jgi:predicted transcriptional regulator YheO
MDAKKLKMARSLYADAKTQVGGICERLGISRATFYRHIVASRPTTGLAPNVQQA